jgi:uncharacterized membrane protein YdbT with pleckstrin-like domain
MIMVASKAQAWLVAEHFLECWCMSERVIIETRESRRSFGVLGILVAVLCLGLPFLGRQRVRITNERIVIESGFWNKVRDDVEVFRIRDVVMKQNIWNRMFGIGDVVVKSTEGRAEEVHVLRGLPDPLAVSEAIRQAWNQAARPTGPATAFD